MINNNLYNTIKIYNTETWGFIHAVRGMRNPKNSWSKSDTTYDEIGTEDLKLAQHLIKAGGEHSKFMRMIHVSMDVIMPRYIWSEWDTYHFNTKNSCSTMHKLLNNKNPITDDMFVISDEDKELFKIIIDTLEDMRIKYQTGDARECSRLLIRAKRLLPESFLQLRTVDTNYAEIRNMYFQRRNHRLPEWKIFCKWVESLPYAKELICYEG